MIAKEKMKVSNFIPGAVEYDLIKFGIIEMELKRVKPMWKSRRGWLGESYFET